MTNKQKLLSKTLDKIKASPEKWSLSRYKKTIIDRWVDDYHVDLDIQRNPYFTYKTAIKYLQSWFSGADLSFIFMVDIKVVWGHVQEENKKGTKTYNYFKKLYDKLYMWLSVDGNNRNHAWYWFFNDKFKLPKGFTLYLWNIQKREEYPVELTKSMSYSDIMNEYGDEFQAWMDNGRRMFIMEIQKCTKPQLHNIFRCINQGKPLEHQEDRNCIDVIIAEWVRKISNDDDKFGKFFRSQFEDDSINKRSHESFVAFTSSLIQDFGSYFPTTFGEKPTKNISEKIVTRNYEKELITSTTQTDVKQAISKLKQYIDTINSGKFISDNLQFTRVLVSFLHKIRKTYYVDDWTSVYKYIDKFHTKMLNEVKDDGEEVTYKFNHHKDSRTYKSIVGAGTALLSVSYQFLSSQLYLMELNGIIRPKLARGSVNYDIRKELYDEQNGISPLTKKKIVDFNDTSKYHVDHIIPISKWLKELHGQDPNHISNLQLIEKEVNLKKSNKIEKSS